MSVGVTKDYKLKVRNLLASDSQQVFFSSFFWDSLFS
jgi:hypothetical protein